MTATQKTDQVVYTTVLHSANSHSWWRPQLAIWEFWYPVMAGSKVLCKTHLLILHNSSIPATLHPFFCSARRENQLRKSFSFTPLADCLTFISPSLSAGWKTRGHRQECPRPPGQTGVGLLPRAARSPLWLFQGESCLHTQSSAFSCGSSCWNQLVVLAVLLLIFDVGLLTHPWSYAQTKPVTLSCEALVCVPGCVLWRRRAGPTPARSSARNCWSWSGGWPRTTRTAWWPTRSSTCCGTWRTATTCPWTSWTRRSALTSRSWITAAPRCDGDGWYSDLCEVVTALFYVFFWSSGYRTETPRRSSG